MFVFAAGCKFTVDDRAQIDWKLFENNCVKRIRVAAIIQRCCNSIKTKNQKGKRKITTERTMHDFHVIKHCSNHYSILFYLRIGLMSMFNRRASEWTNEWTNGWTIFFRLSFNHTFYTCVWIVMCESVVVCMFLLVFFLFTSLLSLYNLTCIPHKILNVCSRDKVRISPQMELSKCTLSFSYVRIVRERERARANVTSVCWQHYVLTIKIYETL